MKGGIEAFVRGVLGLSDHDPAPAPRPRTIAFYLALLDAALAIAISRRNQRESTNPPATVVLWADRDPAAIYAFRLFTSSKHLDTEEATIAGDRIVTARKDGYVVAALAFQQWMVN